jgi:hypothetical protein
VALFVEEARRLELGRVGSPDLRVASSAPIVP